MLLSLLIFTLAPRSEAIILTYHDMVAKRDKSALWFDCTPGELESQVLWMKAKGAHFVDLEAVYKYLTKKSQLPSRAVAITFADNYVGFLNYAWPILKKHKIPVTMFVHTSFVGSRQGRPKMTWNQLKELNKNALFNVGSQTVSHPADVTKLSNNQLQSEFNESKLSIHKYLDNKIPLNTLAFPNGKYDNRVSAVARAAGYLMAFTEAQMPVSRSQSLWQVPRYVHTKYQKAWKDAKY